jgi:hypothetical protein
VGALAGHLKGGDSVEQWGGGRSGAAPHGVEVGEGLGLIDNRRLAGNSLAAAFVGGTRAGRVQLALK